MRGFSSLLLALILLLVPASGGTGLVPRPGVAPPPERSAAAPLPPPRRALPPGWAPGYPRYLRPSRWDPPAPRPQRGTERVRELVLTFDDGPDLFGTPLVLDALDRHGMKGIFFVNGRLFAGAKPQDLARRDLVRKIATRGHLVANHTLTHENPCAKPESMAFEIDANTELITAATGLRPRLFRAPYGARCRRLDEALRVRELVDVGWSIDPQEWSGADEDAVFAAVTAQLARLEGRGILLLHDSQPEAVRALPRILEWIARENARAARAGEEPLVVRDYAVFLPPAPLGETGLEPFAAALAAALPEPLVRPVRPVQRLVDEWR